MADTREETLRMDGLELDLQQSVPGTDNHLVREFIAGNDAAFTVLVCKYKDALTNYLNVMVGNYDVAADLAQETFLRVYRNIGRYSNVWDSGRRAGGERTEIQLTDVRRGPRDEVLRKESSQILGDAIRSLPEKYRTAFIMKEIQELPYEAIARILNCSTGTIKSRLHRARELLQRKLEHYV